MNSFVLLMFFVLQQLWIRINADEIVLGKSPCMYSGSFDPSEEYCSNVPIPVTSLPIECSSFIYDGLIYNEDPDVNPPDNDINNMNNLRSTGKKLYLYYSHGSLQNWLAYMKTTDPSTVPNEIAKLKSILGSDLAAGLILKDLNYIYDSNLDYHLDPNFNNYLMDYVFFMKNEIPNLKIGLYVNASNIIYYSSNPNSSDSFDFNVLNTCMDYYIIGFDKFNPCNDNFRGGIVPINNICGSNHSLTQLSMALNSSMIAKDKMYIEFLANPTPNDQPVLPVCAVTYQKLCEACEFTKTWCADNSDSFYDKGRFANEQLHAQGIITKYIDTIDPNEECECDSRNQFITFKMMLRGFSGGKRITDCSKLNSIAAEMTSCIGDSTTGSTATPTNTYFDYLLKYWFSS